MPRVRIRRCNTYPNKFHTYSRKFKDRLSSNEKYDLSCRIIDVICLSITRNNLPTCTGYATLQKILRFADADFYLLGIK